MREAAAKMLEPRKHAIDCRKRAQLVRGCQTTIVSSFMDPITVLVIANPAAPFLRVLDRLPQPVQLLIGEDREFLNVNAPKADVILNGFHDGTNLRSIFGIARRVRWVHALSAGVERILFPELIESPIPLTNGRAVFAPALAEFAIAAMLFFAKGLRRLVRSQEEGKWDQFDVDWLRGRTVGIVGYGGIGQETARLAHALGMKVVALRRRARLSTADPLLERVFPPEGLREMLAISDYVVISPALTPETRGMIGAGELAVMKPTAVLINLGRGPMVVEEALLQTLREHRIRGAALDVFDQEPLPQGHPFYSLDNVLLSPHSADHTVGWIESAVERFVELFGVFREGRPFENVVDKRAGY